MSVINEATDIVQEKIHNLLNYTKCKSYVLYNFNSNMAESRHEERNKNVELLSRNIIVTHDNSSYGKMIKHVLSRQPSTTSKTAMSSPSPTKRKNPTRAAAINMSTSTNITC